MVLKFYDRAGIGPGIKIEGVFVHDRSMEGSFLFVWRREFDGMFNVQVG